MAEEPSQVPTDALAGASAQVAREGSWSGLSVAYPNRVGFVRNEFVN